uniref:BUD23 rRNA methyltransferase and ribosome maturation factor n=1 Tax=Molossus molossus TaxID=27622 RepID=A0A7J8IX85_MOLMO|nr:BUD23 rRNA methyltransferase and ribosome maturation factor [Molossus molossus]
MASRGHRPEHGGPPELFYNKNEARKYMRNSRMIDVQTKMAGRALELLDLPEDKPCFLLDVGCGTGLSGDYLSDEGHYWVGIDISPDMLDAALDREAQGDLLLGDMGQGIPFKPGSFDGCISISAVQWLCNANKKFYLCLFSGPSSFLPKGLNEIKDEEEARESTFTNKRIPYKIARSGVVRKTREWVLEKKERHRRQGKEVRPDTQYTGRKRKPYF